MNNDILQILYIILPIHSENGTPAEAEITPGNGEFENEGKGIENAGKSCPNFNIVLNSGYRQKKILSVIATDRIK